MIRVGKEKKGRNFKSICKSLTFVLSINDAKDVARRKGGEGMEGKKSILLSLAVPNPLPPRH